MTTLPLDGPPAGGPTLPISRTVAASDESTSVVLDPAAAPQITRGTTPPQSYTDIAYAERTTPDGSALALRLDLLLPPAGAVREGERPPLVVHVPGGGFVISPKEGAEPLRTHLAEAGFAVASIQYRTIMNGATYVDAVRDVRTAVRFLRDNADRYGFDASRVAVWGESAGGYLSAMTGVATDPAFGASGDVQAVVDVFGGSDLARIAEDHDAATQAYYRSPANFIAPFLGHPGRALTDIPDTVERANPITYVDGTEPPFLLLHGSNDTLISPSQTLRLHNALRAAGTPSTRYVVRGGNHGDLAFLGDPESGALWSTTTVMDVITGFLRATLGSVAPTP